MIVFIVLKGTDRVDDEVAQLPDESSIPEMLCLISFPDKYPGFPDLTLEAFAFVDVITTVTIIYVFNTLVAVVDGAVVLCNV